MDQGSVDKTSYQDVDGNFYKKTKKKKRKTYEPETNRHLSQGENISACDKVQLLEVRNKDEIIELRGDLGAGVAPRKKKKKKLYDTVVGEECNTIGIGECAKVEEEPVDDTLSRKRKKEKKLAIDSSFEGALKDVVKVKEEAIDDMLSLKNRTEEQKKKKKKVAFNSVVEGSFDDSIKVKEELVETFSKKKKKRTVNESLGDECVKVKEELDCGTVTDSLGHKYVIVKEEPVDETLCKRRKKRTMYDSLGGCVKVKEEPSEEILTLRKKKRKLVDVLVERGVDSSVTVIEEPFENAVKKGKKHATGEGDSLSGGASVNQGYCSRKSKDNRKREIMGNQRDWSRRENPARPTWQEKKRFQPKFKSILPQNVQDWQPMIFKFDNHPIVRHYIPRKLMAMNGIKQQLGEMDEIDLKIPNIVFEGSSLDDIPGYGYGKQD